MNPTEDDLCRAFANKLKESSEFCSWVLDHTRFFGERSRVRLLHEEQAQIRPHVDAENWWRHWHSAKVKRVGRGQETDVFLVFETTDKIKRRFALFTENKKRRRLSMKEADAFREQAEAYEARARFMMSKAEFLSYEDFVTVLVAPIAFRESYRATCDLFNSYIAYARCRGGCRSAPIASNWAKRPGRRPAGRGGECSIIEGSPHPVDSAAATPTLSVLLVSGDDADFLRPSQGVGWISRHWFETFDMARLFAIICSALASHRDC